MDDRRLKILLVEDDEDDYIITLDLLSDVLGARLELEWVSTYDAAVEAIDRYSYDVYIVDYLLGGHTGLELLREAPAGGRKAPVILLTGQGDPDVDQEAMKLGVADYLVKGKTDAQTLERSIRYSIERAQMLEAMRQLSIRDELTGLLNRREMDRILKEEVQRCLRYGRSMALVMLDVDHFKAINDTYGHMVGDDVLRWLARILRENVRPADKPARYGGEELAIITIEATAVDAHKLAEHIRGLVCARPVSVARENGPGEKRSGLQIPLTVSLGVATLPNDATSAEALIAAADEALYDAKRQGRNRTVLYSAMQSHLLV
jgi:diguanylate cyclase (GGDEF)-like protein